MKNILVFISSFLILGFNTIIKADPTGSLPNLTANPSSQISVPLTVNSLVNLEGMDIWIAYNASVLTATEAVLTGGILENQNYGLQVGLSTPGTIKLIFSANQNLFSGSGIVAYINFSVIGSAGSSSPLTFTKFDINETNYLSNTTNGSVTIRVPLTKPTVVTSTATNITSTSAQLNGTVNPNGASTTYYFEYGTTTGYGSTTSSINIGSGTSAISVNRSITGLNSNTLYHYRIAATNSGGTSYGSDMTFTTPTVPPSVTTTTATNITSNSAQLNGTVNPNSASTTYYFQYGTTTNYGSTTSSGDAGSGTNFVSVFRSISGLSANTTYHYRLVATNSNGTSYGNDMTFVTSPPSTVATPTFSPPAKYYTSPQNVSLSCATNGATIRYTINGTDPTESSSIYTSPILVNSTMTIKARGYLSGWTPSNVVTGVYTIIMHPNFFDDFEDGIADGWLPNTPIRWSVVQDEGDYSYFLNSTGYNGGERTLIQDYSFNNFELTVKIKSAENLNQIMNATYTVHFCYLNEDNYYSVKFCQYSPENKLYRKKDGQSITLASYNGTTIKDNNYHEVKVKKDGSNIIVYFDQQQIISATDDALSSGQIGLGAWQNSAYFDDVLIMTDTIEPILSVSPASINIGYNGGNNIISVSNTGAGIMNWTASVTTGSNWFRITSGSNGTNNGTINFSVDPNPSSAQRTGEITITAPGATGSPKIVYVYQEGSQVPDISVTPTSLSYGSVTVGSNTDKTFVIKNDGTANLNVTAITLTGNNASEFSIQSGGGVFTLAPAATRNLIVRFGPTSAGIKTANLNISSNDPDENPLLAGLSGTATVLTVSDISATPTSWSYGSVTIGSSSNKTFVIKNEGTANLNVTAATLTGTNVAEFSIQSGGGTFTLAPSATRDIVVRFSPTSAGSKTAALSISSNDPDENPFLVTLAGTGQPISAAPPIFPSTSTPTQVVAVEFWINIDVGTSAKPVTNLFGVSFDLNFANAYYIDVVTPHSSTVIPGSFLGNDVIFFQNVDESAGKVSIGNTRKAGQGGVNGYGTVAQVKFIANASTPNNTPVQFSITDVSANDANGAAIPLEPGTLTVTIMSGLIVWPGDTNNDKIVNQADVLPLGLHYGKTGPARQNASNSWVGQFATPWNPELATYANANGDGTINQADVLAIGLNWNKTHTIALGKPEIAMAQTNQSNITNLTVTINGDTNPDKNFFIDIYVNNVTNLFGLSFELIYTPNSFINPLTAEPGMDNIMGNDLIYFPMINKNAGIDTGIVSVGISRKSGQVGVTGTGLVTRITAHMASNALSGVSTTRLSLQNIVANDPNGNPIAIDTSFINLVTHVEDQLTTMPSGMVLGDNYPNPFNAATTIDYQLSQPAEVVLTIYDVQGHEVRHLVKANKFAGCHSVLWDGRDQAGNLVASGIYFYRLTADRFNETKKCVLMK